MLEYKERRRKYLFFRKELNDFESEWITCGCICTVCKKEWKDYCDFVDIEHQNLLSHSVTRLSLCPSLPRMLQMYSVSHSYFMSIDKSTFVLKHFFGNSLSEFCLTHFKTFVIICGCLMLNEQVQNIEKSKA